jgi:hypothetical protein
VRGGFLVSLLGSFALLMFPLRTCLIELLWGGSAALKGKAGRDKADAVARVQARWYGPLTYGILAATVATAVLVPDIWAALSIVGDLASTMQVRRRHAHARRRGPAARRVLLPPLPYHHKHRLSHPPLPTHTPLHAPALDTRRLWCLACWAWA